MRKDDLNEVVVVDAQVGGSVKIHPSDGSQWVLWSRKGVTYLRKTREPVTIVEQAKKGGGASV